MDAAAHALIVVLPRVILNPAGEPVHLGVPGEHSHDAEELAAASPYLARSAIRSERQDITDLARLDDRSRFPEVVVVALRVARREVDAGRFAGFDHAVGLFEGDAHGLLAEDALDAGLDGGHDDLRDDGGGENGGGNVDTLVGEQLAVVGVPSFQSKPSAEELEYLRVLLRDGDDLGARVELVGAGVLSALEARTDDSNAVWRRHVGLLRNSRLRTLPRRGQNEGILYNTSRTALALVLRISL